MHDDEALFHFSPAHLSITPAIATSTILSHRRALSRRFLMTKRRRGNSEGREGRVGPLFYTRSWIGARRDTLFYVPWCIEEKKFMSGRKLDGRSVCSPGLAESEEMARGGLCGNNVGSGGLMGVIFLVTNEPQGMT